MPRSIDAQNRAGPAPARTAFPRTDLLRTPPSRRAGLAARALLILALPLLAAGPAAAQTAAQIDRAVARQNTVIQRFTPPPRMGSVEIAVEDQRRRTPDAEALRLRFPLRSLAIEGAETLPPETLAPLWRDRIGSEITLAELYRIAEAVDQAYVRAGYFSMTVVPAQDFASGRITLRVYESYVATVTIASDVPGIERRLQPYIDRIVAMSPIRIKEAERILGLMSDLGGLEIEGVFTRPDTPTGGGALHLDIGFDRASGLIGLDNLGNDAIGPLELAGTVELNDALGLFETTTLVAVTVPDSPRELGLLQLTQDLPLGHDGLAASYGYTVVLRRPGAQLRRQDIEVETRIATLGLTYPFLRSLSRNLFGALELNHRSDDVDVGDATVEQTRARWLLAALRYDRDLDEGSIAGSVGLGQGLGGQMERPGVPEDYRYLQGDLDFSRPLTGEIGLRLRALGQFAADPLPAAVKITLGGDPYGWAFDGAALSGDSGAAAALELSRPFDTGLGALGVVSLTALADYGAVWNRQASADYAQGTLGSVGLGVSGMLRDRLQFQLVAAAPWHAGDAVDDPGARLFFRLGLPL